MYDAVDKTNKKKIKKFHKDNNNNNSTQISNKVSDWCFLVGKMNVSSVRGGNH